MTPPAPVPFCTIADVAPTIAVLQRLTKQLANDPGQILQVIREATDVRRRMVDNLLVATFGDTVQTGPFAGMRVHATRTGSLPGPRLLGCYEQELHGIIRGMGRYHRVLVVGCAEGWYAVGLARLFPALQVVAYDIDPQSRQSCAELAAANGVGDRVDIRETFDREQLADLAAPGVLVLMDIEGAEAELLPSLQPDHVHCCDWLVETHPHPAGSTLDIVRRTLADHDLTVIPQTVRDFTEFPLLTQLGQFDRFLAQWEGRGADPWVLAVARRA